MGKTGTELGEGEETGQHKLLRYGIPDREPTKKDIAIAHGILAFMIAGSTALATLPQLKPIQLRNITESNVAQYVDYSLNMKFPQMTNKERALYVPAVVDSVSVLEDAPVEGEIGIPDGPQALKARADYVLSGLYWLDNDEIATVSSCEDNGSVKNCSLDTVAMDGLHFAAPKEAEVEKGTIEHPRPEFDSVINDVLAMDQRLDSLEPGVHPVTSIDQILMELGRIVPYYVKAGLLPSLDSYVPPTSVEWIDLSKDPSMKYVAAYIIVGSSDPSKIGRIYIGQEYSNSMPENIAYLRQIEAHELAHRQGVYDESLTDIVAMSTNALMAEDGALDPECGVLLTFRNDALWTAIFMADKPNTTMPSDRQSRDMVVNSLYPVYDYRGSTRNDSPPPIQPLQEASEEMNATIEKPIIDYREATVGDTIDAIFASDAQQERDEFDEIYADWKAGDPSVSDSRITYRVTPYLMIRDANTSGDGKLTEYFIGEPAFFGGSIDKEQRTIDTSGVWRLVLLARRDYAPPEKGGKNQGA